MPYDACLAELTSIVGERYVVTDPADTGAFLLDHRARYRGEALAVVKPATTDEVSRVVKACGKAGVAIVPQGGNTGLCGGATPLGPRPSIVLRLDRMNRIRAVSPAEETITVEAGCILADIQSAAARDGLLFPLSLGAEGSCQIGGNIATNAGGIAVLRYGNMRQLVLGLEVVLADGTVLDGLRRLRKDNAGYDLKQLFVGAEGTLGIVTAASLKLFPAIRSRSIAMMQVAGVEDALTLFARARTTFGERISSFEIIGASYMDFVLKYVTGTAMPFAQPAPWYLLLEVGDSRPEAPLAADMEGFLGDAFEAGLVSDAVIGASLAQEEALWKLRHGVTGEFKLAGKTMSHDTSVPVAEQPAFVARVEAAVLAAYPDANVMMVGHIGDGNIHVVVLFPHERFATADAFEAASDAIDVIIDDIAMELGGSITAEHGVGYTYRRRLARTKNPDELMLMRKIKQMLDPDGMMNPGKIFLPAESPAP
ncbi:FAD-binding oxidoreductase [Azospirillum rugosum]|uniref:FAD/FMN-containing dehydrogenase n=1 Tax=Azospirillum rugosum TaxID=416170 RepID=A0ABS4SR52_9PROT|nr:FAD-binding oxidoreductase [Azospirillum rugosum]MBP2295034.1 FAD/FMN-containing dehydrogenase [Azospirillum rugosum]MDQ0528857.1 FAD/FMN-containing dehydrogenase [Azospirillum rugosum]